MNIAKLKEAEQLFLTTYPGGFSSPEIIAISKKHKMEKIVEFTQSSFAKENFNDSETIVTQMAKLVSKSSMVSVFEKPKFKDYTKALTADDKKAFSADLFELLHGNEEKGFESITNRLAQEKLAKWTLVTVFAAYNTPTHDVFIKPTTTKNVLSHFEIEDIKYKPKPSYEFYHRYRDYVNDMKAQVDSSLSPSNAAFLGFLMMCFDIHNHKLSKE